MVYLKRLLLMIQFLTAIPVPLRLNVDERDFGKGLIFAPAIGIAIGALLAGAYYLLDMIFPPYVTAVFIVIIYIVLTGGIHLDGLGDTFDGVFSNRSKERMLEIMRDSRVGTNAVLALVCILMLYVAMLSTISREHILLILVMMPAAGRIGSLTGAAASTYARAGDGLGKSFIDYCTLRDLFIGIVVYSALFYAAKGLAGLALCLTAFITAWIVLKFFCKKIGGATGDILGAVCELNQGLFLISAYLLMHFKLY